MNFKNAYFTPALLIGLLSSCSPQNFSIEQVPVDSQALQGGASVAVVDQQDPAGPSAPPVDEIGPEDEIPDSPPADPGAGPSNPPAGPSNPPAGPSSPPAGPSSPPAGPSNPPANNPIDPSSFACGQNLNKILICHKPKGRPSNAHTLCISIQGAQNGHKVPMDGSVGPSGDFLGKCSPSDIPDDVNE